MTFIYIVVIAVVHLLGHVWFFATPWTAAHQASLSFTISPNLLKLMSTEPIVPSNHLILCHPLLLLPSVFPRCILYSTQLFLFVPLSFRYEALVPGNIHYALEYRDRIYICESKEKLQKFLRWDHSLSQKYSLNIYVKCTILGQKDMWVYTHS